MYIKYSFSFDFKFASKHFYTIFISLMTVVILILTTILLRITRYLLIKKIIKLEYETNKQT